MKSVTAILLCLVILGCSPSAPSRAEQVKQIQSAVAQVGGEGQILKESKILFPRCRSKTWSMPGVGPEDRCFDGLAGIQSLGDVFFFYEPGHVRIRVHNSHSDTYFFYLVDPDKPQPAGFECIVGNVGFIEESAPANLH